MDSNSPQFEFFLSAPTFMIQDAIPRTQRVIEQYDNIVCSISGGADSDIMLDMVTKLDPRQKVKYVYFDTGIEMEATKRQIEFLKQKYGVEIETYKPKEPVAYAVRKYGYPFYSKQFSEYIYRLQKHNFKREDKPFEELYKEYPNCKAALRWWCNKFKEGEHRPLMTEIGSAPYLKEFMIQNPPTFQISPKCCDKSKKEPAATAQKGADIALVGIRKAEGGVRSTAYKSCFVDGKKGKQHFPLFWFKTEDKEEYERFYQVEHSDAYKVYGCKRTGCAGCPFGSGFESEIEMLEKYEPKLAKAVKKIFEPAHEYTRAYRKFREEQRALQKEVSEYEQCELIGPADS